MGLIAYITDQMRRGRVSDILGQVQGGQMQPNQALMAMAQASGDPEMAQTALSKLAQMSVFQDQQPSNLNSASSPNAGMALPSMASRSMNALPGYRGAGDAQPDMPVPQSLSAPDLTAQNPVVPVNQNNAPDLTAFSASGANAPAPDQAANNSGLQGIYLRALQKGADPGVLTPLMKWEESRRQQAEVERHNQAEEARQQTQLEQGKYISIPGVGLGNIKTGEVKTFSSMPNMNAESMPVGTLPEGTSAPVLGNKYNQYANMPPRQKASVQMAWEKSLAADDADAVMAQQRIDKINRFRQLNQETDTGGAVQNLALGRAITGAYDPVINEMNSINKELAFTPGQRPPGMRLTQGEIFMMRGAEMGTQNPREANENIAQSHLAFAQRAIDHAQFKRDFIQNNGYWNEAVGRNMFNQYLKDNPVFDPAAVKDSQSAKANNYQLNPNRLSLEEYAAKGGFKNFVDKGMTQGTGANQASPGQQTAQPSGGINQGAQKIITQDKIEALAIKAGKTPEQVMKDVRAKGFTVQ